MKLFKTKNKNASEKQLKTYIVFFKLLGPDYIRIDASSKEEAKMKFQNSTGYNRHFIKVYTLDEWHKTMKK